MSKRFDVCQAETETVLAGEFTLQTQFLPEVYPLPGQSRVPDAKRVTRYSDYLEHSELVRNLLRVLKVGYSIVNRQPVCLTTTFSIGNLCIEVDLWFVCFSLPFCFNASTSSGSRRIEVGARRNIHVISRQIKMPMAVRLQLACELFELHAG